MNLSNSSLFGEQLSENSINDYEISIVPNKEKSKIIFSELKKRDDLEIVVKKLDNSLSYKSGMFAEFYGENNKISWAQLENHEEGGSHLTNWELIYDNFVEAKNLKLEQRIGLGIGKDVLGSLDYFLDEKEKITSIVDYFSKKAAMELGDKINKRINFTDVISFNPKDIDNKTIWREYRNLLETHIDSLEKNSFPFGSPLISMKEGDDTGKFNILGFKGKRITIKDYQSSLSLINRIKVGAILNSITVGFLLPYKKDIKNYLLGKNS